MKNNQRRKGWVRLIKIEKLTKVIKGRTVLDDVNMLFEDGKIYGLYGRNGSGKTMLLRAIAGLIFPTEGSIYIDDAKLHEQISFPPSVGVIIENTNLLPQYDGFTNLQILAKIKNIITDEEIKNTLTLVGLDADSKLKVKAYSLGMKQKLAIAQAIMEKPKLLLLDEPTNALDEESILKVREILLELKDYGTTIIIASHNKEDLGVLADVQLKIVDGKISAIV